MPPALTPSFNLSWPRWLTSNRQDIIQSACLRDRMNVTASSEKCRFFCVVLFLAHALTPWRSVTKIRRSPYSASDWTYQVRNGTLDSRGRTAGGGKPV